MHNRARWGRMPLLCAYRGMLRRYLPQNTRKRLRRHGKRLGKRRLLDIQPPYVRQLMEHGRLPAGCPKVFFVAAICVPQMRGSVRGEQCLERGKTYVGNGKNQRWKIRKPTLEISVSSVGDFRSICRRNSINQQNIFHQPSQIFSREMGKARF